MNNITICADYYYDIACIINLTRVVCVTAVSSIINKEMDMIPVEIIQLTGAVKEIIAPLKNELGITDFSYSRRYEDNTRLLLTTVPSWHEYLYNREVQPLTPVDICCNNLAAQKSTNAPHNNEIFIWDHKHDLNCKNRASYNPEQNFHRFHGMSLIINNICYVETLGFSTTEDNHKINYFYEHANDIFYRFKFYFLDKAKTLIKIAEKNKFTIPHSPAKTVINELENDVKYIKNNFYSKTNINKLYLLNINGEDTTITKRELECIKWLMLGKSVTETSLILAISTTTVNTYIKNIKEKLGLFKVSQLVKFFHENHFGCLYEQI